MLNRLAKPLVHFINPYIFFNRTELVFSQSPHRYDTLLVPSVLSDFSVCTTAICNYTCVTFMCQKNRMAPCSVQEWCPAVITFLEGRSPLIAKCVLYAAVTRGFPGFLNIDGS